jgi:hypothetical protein
MKSLAVHLAIRLALAATLMQAGHTLAQQVPEASSCIRVDVGEPPNRGASLGDPGWAITFENTCSFAVEYLGCYSSATPDALGRTVTCSAHDRSSHIGLVTYQSEPGVFIGSGSLLPRMKGGLGLWRGMKPSVSVSLAACPREYKGKYVRFSEVVFSNGKFTAKCEVGDYKKLPVQGM